MTRATLVTVQQALVHSLFVRHRSMSIVARQLGLSQIRVREALVQHERNRLRDAGVKPPPLKEMLRGDVTTRFGVPREEFGGRPAKYRTLEQPQPRGGCPRFPVRAHPVPQGGVRRWIVTAIEPSAQVHGGFWTNLKAYAATLGAELVVAAVGNSFCGERYPGDHREFISNAAFAVGGLLDVALDNAPPVRLVRPLDTVRHRAFARWTVFPHPSICLETLVRIRCEGLKVHLTSGAMTFPSSSSGPRRELGAVIIEVSATGSAHCRHIVSEPDGDGSFQDLDVKVVGGIAYRGRRVEALTFGDIHHAHLDAQVARATWGIGAEDGTALVDRLRPRSMVFHDLVDFDARNHHDARDHHRRFIQTAAGGGDVGAEFAAASHFLEKTRRSWCRSVVVRSNHDEALIRWLRESDFRDDPLNALFFLETSLALHRRLASGRGAEDLFEQTLRRLSPDGLRGVRFLKDGESMAIAGVEASLHGHRGADGRPGDLRFFERIGMRATLGHTHRPVTRDGILCAGVCATDLAYARGQITAWGVGHVVTYASGARQHLLFDGGTFHA